MHQDGEEGLRECCRSSLEYDHDEYGIAMMRCKVCGSVFTIYPNSNGRTTEK